MKNNPIVSICCTTYNHENSIKDAIEGFLIQKTTFALEIIIHDDASVDGTTEIVKQYSEKYPNLIVPILQIENQWSKGIRPSPTFVWPRAKGKYIALCEGDDYWTDPLKLQKQVDFLEANPDFSLCFHNAIVLWDDKSQPPQYFCSTNQKKTSTTEDVIEKWFIPTASMVFRRDALMPLPEWFYDIYNADWAIQMIVANQGKIKYLNQVMSIYRKCAGALSKGIGSDNIFVTSKRIELLQHFNEYTKYKHSDIIKTETLRLIKKLKTLSFRKKIPFIKYLNPNLWIRKIVIILIKKDYYH